MTTSLRLEKITPDNVDAAIGLRVRPDQEHLVAPVVKSLAEAYVHPGTAWPRLVLDGGRPVGFLMAFFGIDFTGDGTGTDIRSGLWRLNIAAGEQGRGYGRFAVVSVAAEIRSRGGSRLTTTWHPGEDGPEAFYRGLGFRPTGETSGDQTVGEAAVAELLARGAETGRDSPQPTGRSRPGRRGTNRTGVPGTAWAAGGSQCSGTTPTTG